MSEGPGFLEFFILEASDYVEQLDGLLLGGSSTGPDADALQRIARALRGTATMAKLASFAEVAGGVERVGRAMQEGLLRWDPALGGALVAAVDDLKTLLHSARRWSPAEDARASQRTAELARLAPARPSTPPGGAGSQRADVAGAAFLAAEASNIAAGLELLNTRGGAADTAANVLRRVRGLRGVAGVKEVPPLADILEATEETARALELGDTPLTPEARQLLEAAAEYLRVVSSALRFNGDVNAPTPARDAFLAAQVRWADQADNQEQVVPIASLFYGDGGPGVVDSAEHPPTSAADRFRLELVSHGEHLRQIADAARRTTDAAGLDRVRRDVRRALRAIETTADSFDEHAVSDAVRQRADAADRLDEPGIATLEDLAAILSQPAARRDDLLSRLRGRDAAVEERPAPAVPEREEPAATSQASPDSLITAAAALIDSGLAALEELTAEPWIAPIAIPEEAIVPIESLLYRGRAALDRAIEVRDHLRSAGSPVDDAALEELFDLVDLARTE